MSEGVGPAYEEVRAGDIVHLYEKWLQTAEIKGWENPKANALWYVVSHVHAALIAMEPTEADLEWRRASGQHFGRTIRQALASAAERKARKQSDSQEGNP